MPDRLSAAAWALRRVAASPEIRRAEAAWMLGLTAEWTWLVSLAVYAYAAGGVAMVGVLGLVRTLPAAVLAPAVTVLADRWPRHRLLVAVHTARGGLIAAAAAVALADGPPAIVLGIAVLEGLLAVLNRPSHMALMPSLARSPDDLVAANVASSIVEGGGILLGPVLGGLLVATGATWSTFAVPAATFGLAAAAVLRIRPPAAAGRPVARPGPREMMLGGLRVVRHHPHAGLILGLFGMQTLVRGLLSVLLVVVAIEVLRLGEEGVGFLSAAIGAGGLAGALFAMALVGRARMAPPFLLGLFLWGLPILVIGLVPLAPVAFGALAVLGAGNATLDIAGFTLLQRLVPNAARGRIFGMLEAIVMLTVGAGAGLAPVLVAVAGPTGALIATGLILPLAGLAAWSWLRTADERAVIPARELALLRGVPMFRQLPMTVLEDVAQALEPCRYAAGSAVVTEGEAGEWFYVVAEGTIVITRGGRTLHRQGAGAWFGEIALLNDVPRTATVTAEDDVALLALHRDAFLAAVTEDRLSREAADDVVRERLAASLADAPGPTPPR
ncbi:MAG TPA: MFS transporter [Candidatus Limnocylindria bacterium]|nr:MFS transporter [Candidatus Limnocylindria bacterium]